MELNKIYCENCMDTVRRMPDGFLNCVVTSPPYFGLRDYGNDDQFGLEETPEAYVQNLIGLFREIHRALRDDGTLWLNLGDSYAAQGARGNNNGEGQSTMGWPGQRQETLNKAAKIKLPPVDHGLKPKDLIGIPWRVAFALQSDGWYLRQDIIWHKPNPMPESVTDRCTKSHEYIFLLTKSARYYYDSGAVEEKSTTFESRPGGVVRNRIYDYDSKENNNPEAYRKNINGNMSKDGVTRTTAGLNLKTQGEKTKETRNKRSVWTVATKPYSEAHFAVYPEKLIVPCIKAGCPEGGIVYDPFGGAGTTALVSHKLNRNWILSELNSDYVEIANKRLAPYLSQLLLF